LSYYHWVNVCTSTGGQYHLPSIYKVRSLCHHVIDQFPSTLGTGEGSQWLGSSQSYSAHPKVADSPDTEYPLDGGLSGYNLQKV